MIAMSKMFRSYPNNIEDIFPPKDIRKHSDFPYWKITGRLFGTHEYNERKKVLLNQVLVNFQEPFLSYSENPIEDNLRGNWRAVAESTWVIPNDCELSELFNWLYLGGWLLYVAEQSIAPELFRGIDLWKAEGFMKLIHSASLSLLLGGFHDNDPWSFGIQEE
jgi:hypothetical protein